MGAEQSADNHQTLEEGSPSRPKNVGSLHIRLSSLREDIDLTEGETNRQLAKVNATNFTDSKRHKL